MNHPAAVLLGALLISFVFPLPLHAADESGNWPSFRGPGAAGIAKANLPDTWDVGRGQNIKWQASIEGLGHGGPVVWGGRIFVVTAVNGEPQPVKTGVFGDIRPVEDEKPFEWKLLCVNLDSGAIVWKRTAASGPAKIKRHPKSSHANCTAATDGKHVVAFFGSEGLYCFDMDGKPLWQKDLGVLDAGFYMVPEAQWEFGSSPVIEADRVIVQCDTQKNSFVASFSLEDGRELWRTARDEVPTWSTPAVIHPKEGPAQVVCNGHKHAAGYDLRTGKEIWTLAMPGDIPIPTPIYADDLVFFTSAHGGPSGIFAVRSSATGNITLPQGKSESRDIAWSTNRGGSYIPTPIVIGDLLYCCNWTGVLTCFDAKSGQEVYHTRLPGSEAGFTASPVATAQRLYLVSEEGLVHVIQPGRDFHLVASNALGTKCLATPAIARDTLLFRTESGLIEVAASRTLGPR
ncbi:MAG TPA: PQQ-binding-like beta-propeller repeat protein [Tepidisphaeraceae bacterium]|nr:PQQ-binding-like beta-propeller repeat protein [Tepidisphaeraceae bacterium]